MKTVPNLNTCIDKYLKTCKPFRAGNIISIEGKLYIVSGGNGSCNSCDLSLENKPCALWGILNSKDRYNNLVCSDMLPHLIFKELKEGL